jgi:histidine decarboxylase
LWYALHRAGRTGFAELVAESLALADYAIAAFARIGIKAWRNPHSITVVVPRPSAAILNRWQMAPEHGIAHIITLPHVTREVIDTLVAEYQADRQNLENKA